MIPLYIPVAQGNLQAGLLPTALAFGGSYARVVGLILILLQEFENKFLEVVKMKQYNIEALFEVSFDANGSHFLVIYGKHGNGGFCCIPNWGISCEMGDAQDVFYNTEKLCGAGLNGCDADAVAKVIKQFGEQNPAKTRNYGEIKFVQDLPECNLVDDGIIGNESYELKIVEPGGDCCCEPVVQYTNRAFILHWEDMLTLAEKAGLFDEGEAVLKALTGKGVEL